MLSIYKVFVYANYILYSISNKYVIRELREIVFHVYLHIYYFEGSSFLSVD